MRRTDHTLRIQIYTTLPESNSSPMKIPMFPCKFHQHGGFSMAMLVLGRVRIRDFPYNPMTWGWDVSTINPTRSGGVWILRDDISTYSPIADKLRTSPYSEKHETSRGPSFRGVRWMYPDPNVPRHGKSLYKPYNTWVFMGYNLQQCLGVPK